MGRIIEHPNNFKFWFRGKQSMQCAKGPLESGPGKTSVDQSRL
jgi:hypothetical protein